MVYNVNNSNYKYYIYTSKSYLLLEFNSYATNNEPLLILSGVISFLNISSNNALFIISNLSLLNMLFSNFYFPF